MRRENIFRNRIRFGISALLLVFLAACATVVPPAGGPIDNTPPVAEEFKPENYSMNFSKKKISIKFDEYVELKNLNKQLVVSPEMPEKPEIKIQGKKVLIRLPDSLSENTTYTIFFGNAIVNYKEGLPVSNFEYVFSTGNEVDSLMIEGYLVNAYDHKPVEGAFVMLYKEYDDSVPYKKRPYYLTKVEANGHYVLNNIHEGTYKLFALNDMNSNYLFDQPIEEIAFVDSLVTPYIDPYYLKYMPKDSGRAETAEIPQPLNLFMFTETEKEQMIVEKKLLSSTKFRLVFALPADSLQLKALDLKKDTVWHFDWISPYKDTLISWLTGVHQDTLHIEVSDGGEVLDTLRFILHKPKKTFNQSHRKKKKKVATTPKARKVPKLKYKTNARGGFPFYAHIKIDFDTPIEQWDPAKIKILRQRDTIIDTLNCKPYFIDPEYKMHLVIPTKFGEYERWGLFIPDSVFFDIYGHSHDTITNMFVTTEMRQYGSLKLTVDYHEDYPLIIQLTDGKQHVLYQQKLPANGIINYPYLKAGDYYIKAIRDENDNGRWDTGNYLQKRQPEMTYFVEKKINIRTNWDVEHKWIIKE
jgi:hypothetical protein